MLEEMREQAKASEKRWAKLLVLEKKNDTAALRELDDFMKIMSTRVEKVARTLMTIYPEREQFVWPLMTMNDFPTMEKRIQEDDLYKTILASVYYEVVDRFRIKNII